EREQSVLNLVPLACSRREVADTDRDPDLVGEPLQLVLPHMQSIAVAAASVGGDEDLPCVGVSLRSDLRPPRVDRGDREYVCVVSDAEAHEASVGGDVGDAVRNRLADGLVREVVNVDELRLARRLPLSTSVLEVADQLLLLGVDGDDGNAPLDARLGGGVDVL